MKPRKDQRAALHRWNRYVLGERYAEEVARLHPQSKEDKKSQRNNFDLIASLHKAESKNVAAPPEPAHRFEVTLEEDSFTQEKFDLFQHYQEHVHHEEAIGTTPVSFRRFLCDSPLVRESVYDSSTSKPQLLGSFHQLYRLDGRLVAIGVLDLLPHGVSGVYFIYHADYERHSFGKLGALREAAMALEDGYGHYYMGYYIHSCAKMRYKGEYQPQYFLDLDDLNWQPLDGEALALMGRQKYVSLARERARAANASKDDGPMKEEDGEGGTRAAQLSSPREMERSGLSILEMGVPGVMTVAEVEAQIDLDDVNIQLSKDRIAKTSDLVVWEETSVTDPSQPKGFIAELAGCVGPQLMRPDRLVVRF